MALRNSLYGIGKRTGGSNQSRTYGVADEAGNVTMMKETVRTEERKWFGLTETCAAAVANEDAQPDTGVYSYTYSCDNVIVGAFSLVRVFEHRTLSKHDPDQVAAPVFDPVGGAYDAGGKSIQVTCATPGATIFCQFLPDEGSAGAWQEKTSGENAYITVPGVLQAYATKIGMEQSAVASTTYTVDA
jgi:hypothetical protein